MDIEISGNLVEPRRQFDSLPKRKHPMSVNTCSKHGAVFLGGFQHSAH